MLNAHPYGKKVWSSYKNDKTHRKEVYRCNDKYKRDDRCATPVVTVDEIKHRFLIVFTKLMRRRSWLIEDCIAAKTALCDTSAIDMELEELNHEIQVIAELSRKAIIQNSRMAQNQDEFNERNNADIERHRKAQARVTELEAEKLDKIGTSKTLDKFINDIQSRPRVLMEFDESLWLAVIDKVVVRTDGKMTFRFRNGSEVTV